jgi:hypothetical protein
VKMGGGLEFGVEVGWSSIRVIDTIQIFLLY